MKISMNIVKFCSKPHQFMVLTSRQVMHTFSNNDNYSLQNQMNMMTVTITTIMRMITVTTMAVEFDEPPGCEVLGVVAFVTGLDWMGTRPESSDAGSGVGSGVVLSVVVPDRRVVVGTGSEYK